MSDKELPGFDEGKQYGSRWVAKLATKADIKNLRRWEEFYETRGDNTHQELGDGESGAFSAAEHLFYVLEPENEGSDPLAQEFWEYAAAPYTKDKITASFVEGFVVGALEARGQK